MISFNSPEEGKKDVPPCDGGHATVEVPVYDDCTDKYINVNVGGTGNEDSDDGD